jgi:7-alpha-hydroxysteroid dehydrogenase
MKNQNLFNLTNKVAIVTGGGNGIGKACCLMLADAGASIAVGDLKLADAETVVNQIKQSGGNAIAVECNVMDDSHLVNLVERTVKELGGLHILVNNAGGGGGGRENPFHIDV